MGVLTAWALFGSPVASGSPRVPNSWGLARLWSASADPAPAPVSPFACAAAWDEFYEKRAAGIPCDPPNC
ncbi:MAG: hypothetical protein IBJ10_01525 [Phycisphaerales bacterium]|nr:hypothetical protein [Phycisphaerales bacterium]